MVHISQSCCSTRVMRYTALSGGTLFLHYGELTDGSRLSALLTEKQPHVVYHLPGDDRPSTGHYP
jgi:GDP-D-mannose dehydratase